MSDMTRISAFRSDTFNVSSVQLNAPHLSGWM
jgi:hypothetical protein